MNRLTLSCLAPFLFTAFTAEFTLADEVAAERARIANQRIQVEQERRVREEEERRAREEEERRAREEAEQRSEAAAEPADRIEMSRALEQLRELGALRDAGYVTEEEFERLKKKIIDGAF